MERTLCEKEDSEEEIFYSPERMEEKIEENEDINEEKKKIDQLRDKVEKQDPACKVISQWCAVAQHTHTVFLLNWTLS